RVLDAIAARDELASNTAIVVTSDHGEAFREHGMVRHGFELWEELVRVPLIIHVPGVAPRKIQERRSAIDVVPTALELLLTKPDLEGLSGRSLASELAGAPAEPRPIFIDMPDGPYNGERQALIDNDLKLIVSRLRPMGLYDLATDPGEQHNLIKETSRVQPALSALKQFRSGLSLVHVKPR